MKTKVLEVKNLTKAYHDIDSSNLVVDNINFDLYKGEILAIVGPSGCGKSTILSILTGIENKTSGEINTNNKTIGYMLQKDSLLDWLTILDNCLLGLKIQKKCNNKNKEYVINLLKKYGLENYINKYPNTLSGGMRQRVAIIRTLATNPDILLLDEATSALDYQTSMHIANDIYNITKKEEKTAILVTHDINIAVSLADRIVVLTKSPARIKNIYNINLTNKSTPINNKNCKEFNDYYNTIWSDLDD